MALRLIATSLPFLFAACYVSLKCVAAGHPVGLSCRSSLFALCHVPLLRVAADQPIDLSRRSFLFAACCVSLKRVAASQPVGSSRRSSLFAACCVSLNQYYTITPRPSTSVHVSSRPSTSARFPSRPSTFCPVLSVHTPSRPVPRPSTSRRVSARPAVGLPVGLFEVCSALNCIGTSILVGVDGFHCRRSTRWRIGDSTGAGILVGGCLVLEFIAAGQPVGKRHWFVIFRCVALLQVCYLA